MSSARTSSGSRPPVVPATPVGRSMRKKNHLNLSAKAFDKMSKRLLSVEKSTGQSAMASWANSESNQQLATASHRIEGIPELGEGGHRTTASYVIAEGDDNAAGAPDVKSTTEYHLRRFGKAPVSRGLTQGAGKGPDGAALAAAAAKSLKGKGVAPIDSFLNEGSFVFNPLNRRVPQQSPRKAKARTASSANNAASLRATSGPSIPSATVGAAPEPRPPSQRYPAHLNQAGPSSQAQVAASEPMSREVSARPDSTPTADSDDPALVPLALVDRDLQEALILEDLLYVLLGIEGQYITYASTYDPEDVAHRLRGAHFTIDSALDAPLRDLVDRILPLATDYTAIYAFIETDSGLEYGTVNHALCSAIRDLLHDYELLVVQLEHQMASSTSFSLQKLFMWIQETARTLAMVRALTDEIVGISHADLFDDEDDDDSSDGDGASDISGTSALERERRALLGLDDPDDEGVEGGIAKGGEVLSMLWDRITRMSGDPKARTLFTTLFQRASQPYAQTMVKWITTGDLSDTYEEFMVMEDAKVTRAALESDPTDEYWETRYTLRDETTIAKRERQRQLGLDLDAELEDEEENPRGILTGGAKIPSFLEPWKHKILLAGKYLNVIRECGLEVPSDPDKGAENSGLGSKPGKGAATMVVMNDESFFRRIEGAYQRANSALLKLLLEDQHILERLRSLKHFFFFSESDFLSSFLEQSAHELAKKVSPTKTRETVQQRLQTHLGAVLGSSSTVGFEDPYREDVRIVLASEGAYDQLKRIAETKGGIEATKLAQANAAATAAAATAGSSGKDFVSAVTLLQFDIAVKFPVSLVISRKNILRYQFVSRGLFHLKTLERSLSELWLDHSSNLLWKQRTHPALEKWKQKLFLLRSRMTFFVQQLLAFQLMEVLEPNYLDLERRLRNVKTVDQLMKDHFAFLNTTRKELMFTDLRYLELHAKLTEVIHIFVENRTRFQDQVLLETERWRKEGTPVPQLQDATREHLAKFERHWEKYAKTYKDVVNLLSTTDNPAALPLAYRFQSSNL
ncbi:Gamma-tubulin complex component protein [Kalmanozyma brasiliensis GHG001]|uniref:Spindle pole body component n=1 Tax=Kalmanozyma brasiliensis (strain GHG001) TaxID=1365824 RepID=V5EVY3_KALBG|nr:Gamma-tubulin complex component protein [Kalmanozyma brasiliensis GHG001]EST07453.1 Gamma-tubulin complex component protein [Kalmanozyma brasiliensis GHG001]